VLLFATGSDDHATAAEALVDRCRDDPVCDRWWLTLRDDTQLRIEHALDLRHQDLAVFIVDNNDIDGAYHFEPIAHEAGHSIASAEGDLGPRDLLHTVALLAPGDNLPACYALHLRSAGARALSAHRTANVDEAFAFLRELLEEPAADHWNSRLTLS
jgi:hypothetical protein